MTKHTDSCTQELRDRRIEITPEMVEAGCKVLWGSGRIEFESSSDDITVFEILQAALEIAAFPDHGRKSSALDCESAPVGQ